MAANFCFMLLCGIPTAFWCCTFVLLGYLASKKIEQSKDRRNSGLICGCTLLFLFLLAGYLLPHFYHVNFLNAIGMSYYALSIAGYLFDQSKGKVPVVSLTDMFLYGGSFTELMSGPVKSSDLLLQYHSLPDFDESRFHEGI